VLRRNAPLFASWNVTFNCNLYCHYCGTHEVKHNELGTDEIKKGLDKLWSQGVRWLTFSGGEPFIRRDMIELLGYAKRKGFNLFLSTNGWLLPKREEALQWLDHVNLSMDGGREAHDRVRGEGAFDKVLDAVAICRKHNVTVSWQCTLSAHNLGDVKELLDLAKAQGVTVMFHPATMWLDSSLNPNPIAPPVAPYRDTIAQLIRYKKQGYPIRNSIPGLKHLMKWPDKQPIWCSAGAATCTVESNGTMLACHQYEFAQGKSQLGVGDPMSALPNRINCAECWCGPLVELGLIYSLRPGAWWNAAGMF
jgi:MoaA/NifB/PqqE/SkfB family radical SAM enzyme